MGTLANGADPDEMSQNVAFYQGLHYLLRLKQSQGTEVHLNLETLDMYMIHCIRGSLYQTRWKNSLVYKGLRIMISRT